MPHSEPPPPARVPHPGIVARHWPGGQTAARARRCLARALAVPGGVARLSLGPAAQRPRVQVRQGDADVPVLVVGDAIEWTAVLGIPLAAPGDAHVTVLPTAAGRAGTQVHYTVAPSGMREQQLTVSPRTVDLSPQDQARYERERDHQARIMATWSEPGRRRAVPAHAPAHTGRRSSSLACGGCSTGRPAIRTAAWTLPPHRHAHRGAAAGHRD